MSIYAIQHLRSTQDTNGNPRRVWARYELLSCPITSDIKAEYVDEGYKGFPKQWGKRSEYPNLPDFNISPTEYRALLEEDDPRTPEKSREMNRSSFYNDGHRDGLNGDYCSPPDNPVYAKEYSNGFYDACKSIEPSPHYEGSNDTQE